ncbi:MAG: tetratricopeptide repeat protein [Polyangiales bacterium]
MSRRLSWIAACSLLVLSSSRLQAQHAGENRAAADALFDEGRALMQRGELKEACAKLEASHALDPAVGTSLNLAECYERAGRTASAWSQFRETVSAARRAGSADREQLARERVKRLEERLSYLTIVTWKGQDVKVKRDGVVIEPGVFGTALPVDPGIHEITAAASGKRAWSTQVEVGAQADRVSVTVPILADDAAAPSELAPAVQPTASDHASTGSTQRTLAIVSAAVGVAGIATGTVFGLMAMSAWSDAKASCDPYPYCGQQGVEGSDDAARSGTISTIGFVAGGVGAAAAAVLWLTAPSDQPERAVSLMVSPFAIGARGRF